MKTAFLKTPVEPQLLARFWAFAASNDLSPSVALRRVVSHVLTEAGYTLTDYDPSEERTNDYAQWARRRQGQIHTVGSQPILIARVSPGMKEAFDRFAGKRKETTPAALKKLIEKVVESVPHDSEGLAHIKTPDPRSERVTVRFSKTEMAALRGLAEEFGGVREWLVALARSRIQPTAPQFSLNEVQALYESNRELWAIGRNINQVAHAINLDIKQTGRLESSAARLRELEGLNAVINAHTSNVMRVCNASLDRWGER